LRAIQEGNPCLLSGGAPDSPVHHRTLFGARFPSRNGAVDRCSPGAVGAPDTVRCTPDSPVPQCDCWLGHASRAESSADRWLTGQSGAPPDSPVNYSRTPPASSESDLFTRLQPGAPDTVRCSTGHCPVHHRTVRCAKPS
jgi:hypothetical protein